ncbi:MAG TPA: SDR family NAD(P)-dependent oxidoreductase [Rhizomicrobium sp.]|jgi:3-oxoacyl-[acyl-carrier protein] reductase|nr:SDR family NAD(P)-dependent oxidoreductase [Rhizomicrobium sp.]
MKPLTGKIAVITGSNRGIGRSIAQRLSREGANVVLAARDASVLSEAADEIREAGGRAETIALDLRMPEACAQLVDFAVAKFGRIDIVVNNAGATKLGDFTELTDADWADGFALKFFAAVRVTRAAWPHLKASGGSVVNISGIGGRTPGPMFAIGGSVNAAMNCLTKSLADTGVRDKIRVNGILPGYVRTDRLKHRLDAVVKDTGVALSQAEERLTADAKTLQIGEPEDIASLVAFIVGPEGRFFHGALIDMDGGATKAV